MKINKKIEWEFLVDRAYLPLSYSLNAFVNNRKYIRRYLDISEEGTTGQIFYPNDVYWVKGLTTEVAAKEIEHHTTEGNEYLWRMARICEDRGEKLLIDLKNKISRGSVENLSARELEALFGWAVEEIKDFSIFITIPWMMENYLNSLITKVVEKAVGNQAQEVLAKLLLPIKINASSKETPAIWRLAGTILKDDGLKAIFQKQENVKEELMQHYSEFLKEIDDFINDYGWIHVRWFKGTPITRDNVIERLLSTIKENPEEKIVELEKNKGRIFKFANDFAEKHSLSTEEKDTIFLIKEYVYIRTYRTDTLSQAFYALFPLIEKVAERLKLTIDDCLYHSEAELRKKLIGEDLFIDVEARKKMWAIFVVDDEYEIYSGEADVEKLKKEQGVLRGIENISEVKGQSAFKGSVKGKAKIVLDPHDIPKVEKGDVLVAVMTFPSYIAAMERAVAFVTDEGGILCHASIIAREMKKPCVISTKMATKVFKDGDIVEVDANSGIVKKIG